MSFATLATLATPVTAKSKLGVARFFSTLPPFATPKIKIHFHFGDFFFSSEIRRCQRGLPTPARARTPCLDLYTFHKKRGTLAIGRWFR